MTTHTQKSALDPQLLLPAIRDAFRKLSPRAQFRNPVMFVVFVCSIMTTILWLRAVAGHADAPAGFILAVALWLWFTLLFANFAEAIAEGRGKAQAASLRNSRRDVVAHKIASLDKRDNVTVGAAHDLRKGDLVIVKAGEFVPGDGDVIEGAASVDESAVTGESAPVIRESGGDRSAVTGGTRVLSDWIIVRIANNPGESFLDRMIAMVEGASRRKTPNEIALTILLAKFTLIFLLACATLLPYSLYAVRSAGHGEPVAITVLVALLVCLIPTTIGGLLSAIGIAGMDRMIQANVIAMSGRAVEAAGDVDVLLLDKTGTITLGNRQAVAFHAAGGVSVDELASAAYMASLADETPEGRSIVVLAKEKFGVRERDGVGSQMLFVPFSANTRMSGVDIPHEQRSIRKGALDAISKQLAAIEIRARARRAPCGRRHRAQRRHAAHRQRIDSEWNARARRGRTEGHRQRRHPRTFRRTARDGHPHHHDHRRQSAHGGVDRGGSRRRRLSRRGDARSETETHPRHPGRRPSRRHVRRRHQRRAGARAGRCRGRHEFAARRRRKKPATWSIWIRIRPSSSKSSRSANRC